MISDSCFLSNIHVQFDTERVCPPFSLASAFYSVALLFNSIEIATRAADHFTRIYYTAYDSDTRLADLPQFYRPNSSLTWNGKPFQGTDGLIQLVSKMPATKHEVQSFDCHPIPGWNCQPIYPISFVQLFFRQSTTFFVDYCVWKCHSWSWSGRKPARHPCTLC